MIRLALVIPTLDRSGAEKQFALLAAGLPKDRFEVEVVALTRSGPLEADLRAADIPVHVLGKRWRFDLTPVLQLRRWLRERQPDIVHSWLFAANSTARLAAPRRGSTKIVISERCVDSWKSGWQHWVDRRLWRRTDRMLANSQSVADFYAGRGYDRERIVVIPNGVAVPPLPTTSRGEFLRELGFPPQAKVAMYVGRLAKQKRIRDLLWAAQLLRQSVTEFRFVLVGDGPDRTDLEQYGRDVEVSKFSAFLGHRPDAAALLHHADAFWLASDFEGMSNSLMEAMACGKPCVVSDIAPNRELVIHDQTGYRMNVGDSVGFAQFTQRLLQGAALATRLGQAGAARMAEHFSVSRMIERHVAFYEDLVQATGAA